MTERNKKILEEDLDLNYDTRHGSTGYIVGLEKAYEFFANSEVELSRPGFEETLKIILFLSDGNPTTTSEEVGLRFEFLLRFDEICSMQKYRHKVVFSILMPLITGLGEL